MSTTRSHSQFIALDAEALWSVIGDPARLPEWHSGYREVRLDGPPGAGVRGDYVQANPVVGALHRRLAPPFIISVADGRVLTLTQPEPVADTRIEFTLVPVDGGTVVTETVTTTAAVGAVSRFILSGVPQLTARTDFARLARLAGPPKVDDALTVVIAGGSGALGQHLAADLSCRGHRAVILTRSVDPAPPFDQLVWDGRSVGAWADALAVDGPVAVVNLAGKLVDCPPTERNIAALRDSRVDATRALVEASKTLHAPVARWLQASTTAIWSDAGEQWCVESTPLPVGLPQMTGVAQPWEEAVTGANTEHLTILRTSIVLDGRSAAMKRLVDITRAGLGGRVGSGKQWFSWIHVDDWLAIARAALGLDPAVEVPDGVVVGASPNPVRNVDLMASLRHALHRPPAPPTPAPMLKVGAVFLRTDPALGLTGRRARSEVLAEAGFEFRFPELDAALADLLGRSA
ncbi:MULTISPECIES: DUF1731 domain-containing protein [unclassified Gordonia (in: high G+C Gram-positive bacteria)]|uniref:DUF1731 domain-containing protein n=1 Tax=unclassified Gordonia (in: high G+C Gram-positive bacteria) TaxID=2657482 RepID=UPI0009EE872C|nr:MULTISPECIES: DUF1731 domain-containing protein [unclassified Gordonia (in: high G+C Gram-positive bacteria)]